jgi:hypothetical protein
MLFVFWAGFILGVGGFFQIGPGISIQVIQGVKLGLGIWGIVVWFYVGVIAAFDTWCGSAGYYLGFQWGGWGAGPGATAGCNPVPWYL